MDDEVDVVVTGHTNWAVNCVIDGKIVTGAASAGRLVTDIDLTVSRATKDVVAAKVENKIVTRTVDKAPDLTTLVTKYKDDLGADREPRHRSDHSATSHAPRTRRRVGARRRDRRRPARRDDDPTSAAR